MDSILRNYQSDGRKNAKTLMQDGAKVTEEDVGDGIAKLRVQDVIVIAGTNSRGVSFNCVECETDVCGHCIVARIFREGLSEEYLKKRIVPVSEITDRINSFYEEVLSYMEGSVEHGWKNEWRELSDIEHDTATYIAADICTDLLVNEENINEVIKIISLLIRQLKYTPCSSAVYDALRECDDELKERLYEMSAVKFADAVIKRGHDWLLDHIPDLNEEDTEYLMDAFRDHGLEAYMFKDLYFRTGRYEEYIEDSEDDIDLEEIMGILFILDSKGEYDTARKIISMTEDDFPFLADVEEHLGTMNIKDIFSRCLKDMYRESVKEGLSYDDLTASLGDYVINQLENETNHSSQTLCAFVNMGYADEVEEYIRENGYHKDKSWIQLADRMEDEEKYETSILMRRKIITGILDKSYSISYDDAAECMVALDAMHTLGQGTSVSPNHEEFVAELREKHKRKQKFWELLD
jgi:hypothetical protein